MRFFFFLGHARRRSARHEGQRKHGRGHDQGAPSSVPRAPRGAVPRLDAGRGRHRRPRGAQRGLTGGLRRGQQVREATASEPLSLRDEYENQASWRAARDKLTFIVCAPLEAGPGETASGETTASVRVRGGDAEDRTRGDVNLFLHAAADGDDDEGPTAERRLEGEVDVMIAAWEHRGRGLGGEVVRALLAYLWRHRDEVLAEQQQPRAAGGAVDYFGELTLAMPWDELGRRVAAAAADGQPWLRGYREMAYE